MHAQDLCDVITKVICFAVNDAGFYAAAGHPYRKAAWVVVTSIIVFGKCAWQ